MLKFKYKIIDVSISIVLVVYMLIQSHVYINGPGNWLVIATQLFGIAIFGSYLLQGKMHRKWLIFTLIFLTAIIISSILVSRKQFGIGNTANVVSLVGISILILRNKIIPRIAMIWFIYVAGYYIFLILEGVHPNLAHAGENARNGISVHMLFVTVTIYIIYYLHNKTFPLLPAFLFLIISIWAIGRGGILTSGILLISLVLVKLKEIYNQRMTQLVALIGISFLLVNFSYVSTLFIKFVELERVIQDISSRTDQTGSRFVIIEQFFSESSIIDILVGQEIEQGSIGKEWGGNAHNSFLGLIIYSGLLGFIVFIAWIIINIKLFKIKFELGILMFVVFIRMMTEYVVWFSVFDYVIYLFFFLYIDIKSKNQVTNKLHLT
jgi:hypothetical protein